MTAAGGRVDVAAGDRAQEARLARDRPCVAVVVSWSASVGEHAAVDEPERLLERVVDLDAGWISSSERERTCSFSIGGPLA